MPFLWNLTIYVKTRGPGSICHLAKPLAGWLLAGRWLAAGWLAAGCDLLCTRTFTRIWWLSCFLASAKQVTPLFWGLPKKVRPALRKAGRTYILALFHKVGRFSRLSSEILCHWPCFCAHLRPALRKAGCTLTLSGKTCCDLV